MKEETKEEYLARHRKQEGLISSDGIMEQAAEKKTSLKARLKSLLFLVLLGLFFYAILQIFGMLKSN